MQEDMHYYGTYAMARAAGLKVEDAKIIAYAAQYVDDSTANDSEIHQDGGMFEATATAHTTKKEIYITFKKKIVKFLLNSTNDINKEQRKVWVPFHFFPGGIGQTLSEKLKCVKDSKLAQEMVKNHIRHAVTVKDKYGLALMGIMAHVYADTFSHYGFSGVSSRENDVVGESIQLHIDNENMKKYLLDKYKGFLGKYVNRFRVKNWRRIAGKMSNANEQALGHGAVGTYPDRPFLIWEFAYKNNNKNSGQRNNHDTFLEGCEKIHQAFSEYANQAGISSNFVDFSKIKTTVSGILAVETDKDGRIEAWKTAINSGDLFEKSDNEALEYSLDFWEQQKDDFEDLEHSYKMLDKHVYKFHQAAIYHRNYTLKQLLPKHGIMIL